MTRTVRSTNLALAAVLLAAPASAGSLDLEPLSIPHHTFALDNGLRVVVHEDHSVPIVAVNLWYHVGSKNETRGRTGFAHLFEHFFFNGSENHPFGFREAMDDIGANNRNGSTNTDRTNFFEDVPVSALERTLYLEADRMGFLAGFISEEMLERERGVVQNEKRQGENQPYGRVFERIVEAIYPYSHPYSWSTIGSMADLEAATLDDVKEWYASYYSPNNCVLSLAGDITEARAQELVTRYFGAIPPGPPLPRFEEWIPRFEENIRDGMEDRVPQARIYRVYHVPGWNAHDTQRLKLSASVLSGSRSARIDRRLVYEKQVATDVSAFVWDKEIAGNVFFVVTVKPGVEPADAERELDTVLAEYLEEGPSVEELERARTRLVASFVRDLERLGGFGGRAEVLSESTTLAGNPEGYLRHFEVMVRTDPGTLRATSREWLGGHHYTLTVRPYPDWRAEEETIDRSLLPDLGEAPEVGFPEVQRRELGNGLGVLLLERHGVALVNVTLVVDSGYAADPGEAPGTAALALEQMTEGTKSRNGFQIVDELDSLGAQLFTSSSLDQSFVRLRALTMNLEPSLDVFSDVVLNPVFPEEMVELGKRRQLARIQQEEAQPVAMALRVVPALLYGEGHSYSNPLTGTGTAESVSSLDPDALATWHRTWFQPNASTLVVTGDITMETLLPALESTFGRWPRGEVPEKKIPEVTTEAAGKVFLIDKPAAEQSVIVAGHVSKPGGQPEDLALETAMRLFGGMSTSRLNRNLRLDKHWSYGCFGGLWDARGQRPFLVIAPVQTDKTAAAMEELRGEIEGIAGRRPVRGDEFDSIKRNMVLRLPGRFETLDSLESAAIDMLNYGYPPGYFSDYAARVRQLTEAALNEAVARFVDPDDLVWVVVGDVARIEPEVHGLAYGEVVRLDPY
jgi:zinc protease